MKCCPTCGQTLPPKLRLGIYLTPMEQVIVERLHRAGENGLETTDLVDYVYSLAKDGGPLWASNSVKSKIYWINKKIKPIGYRIRCNRIGRGSFRAGIYVFEKFA